MRLGFHLSIAGSYRRALAEARSLGCQAVQIFVQNPRSWRWREPEARDLAAFRQARRHAGVWPLVVHLTYLPNLAATEPELARRSRERLLGELRLARELGAEYLVCHPGHGPREPATFRRVADLLADAVREIPPPPLLLLENTAGQGREIGSRMADLTLLKEWSGVPLGLCLDTAHALGAGYDLGKAAGVEGLLAEVARGPGLAALRVIHLNDSQAPAGSRRDRHQHLGRGCLGLAGLRYLLGHPALRVEAVIMETPRRRPVDEWLNLLTARSLVPGPTLLPPPPE
ncbi:MAG: deoxyribonuclease IV [Syntrophobacterales bacterium]|nr:deoxyribonuclease IV [Syntrophobacterales bacterium]